MIRFGSLMIFSVTLNCAAAPFYPIPPAGTASRLNGCDHVDARRLSSGDLKRSRENATRPIIFEHAWEVLDNSTWSRADFEQQGQFGNLTLNQQDFLHNEYQEGNFSHVEALPMFEAIDINSTSVIFVPTEGTHMRASWANKNRGAPHVGPLSGLTEDYTFYAATLMSQGQWTRMHTHRETLFVQVSGRKGWVFGDSMAWLGEVLDGDGPGGGPIIDDLFSLSDARMLFHDGVMPKSIQKNPLSFMTCETKPGDAVYWPGLCDGECGWWHAAYGVDVWSAGIVSHPTGHSSAQIGLITH